MQEVVVVGAADDAFARPTAVMLRSVVENLGEGVRATIYLIDNGFSRNSRARVEESLAEFGQELHWLSVDNGRLAGIPSSSRFGQSPYTKLLIPELLPASIERALYLDSDIVVCDDISELWTVDLGDTYVGAVADPVLKAESRPVPVKGTYFNAGVLLFNLDRWRREGKTQAVLDFVAEHQAQLEYADQDALNASLEGEWVALDPRWNAASCFFPAGETEPDAAKGVGILHFTGPRSRKPWAHKCRHPLQHVYLAYEAKTPWRGAAPMRLNVLDRLGPFGRRLNRVLRSLRER